MNDLVSIEGIQPSAPMMQVKGQYATAIQVQCPRHLNRCLHAIEQEAAISGERFYYSWSVKDKKTGRRSAIEGPSIKLALAACRVYGNAAVELLPVQETPDAWIFTAAFVDVETGFTLSRQFRQSKGAVVYGDLDNARKEDIRFQIGQSKAIRNVVVNAVPDALIDAAMRAAKSGAMKRLDDFLKNHSLEDARLAVLKGLDAHGVTTEQVLNKIGVAKVDGLDKESILRLRCDLSQLNSGQEYSGNLFPPVEKDDVPEELKALHNEAEAARAGTEKEVELSAPKKRGRKKKVAPKNGDGLPKKTTRKKKKAAALFNETEGDDAPGDPDVPMDWSEAIGKCKTEDQLDGLTLDYMQEAENGIIDGKQQVAITALLTMRRDELRKARNET